ncbi:uncharacterized protein [Nicotiana sylvestris]|uniref:uncharacterized protein n=1 Tax=Nicotiana sylvestris TaxID=4096 RepID=UPI00388C41A5
MPDVEALTKDFDEIRTAMWDESRPMVLAKGMLFPDKVCLSRACKMHNVKECREMTVWESSPVVYKVVCRRWFWPCHWMLCAMKKKTGLWKVGKYIPTHTCEIDTFNGNHFNLDIDLISLVLIPYIKATIRHKIKECITAVHQEHGHTITKRKAYLGQKRAFEIVYGNWDKSFVDLPRYMAALQQFNPETVVEWKLEHIPDGTHVYRKYDIKLLIDVAVDANGQIFPLAFAICANESQEMWTLFLNHLKEHVVKQRSGICLTSDRHGGILSYVENLPAWLEPYAYYRYYVRHFKANFQKAYPKKDLHDLMWMTTTDHQQYKFRMHMEYIRQEDEAAYRWLMQHDPEKWTLYADGGRRWGTLTTNVSESFNGLLKSARGLPVTAMVRLSFQQMAERFVERSAAATSLMEKGVEFMPVPMKRFEKYRWRAHWHSFLQYDSERNVFEVRTVIHQNRGNNVHTVNESRRLCSCEKWSIYHMPCSHAIKYFQQVGLGVTNYADQQYSVAKYLNTYSGQLQPVGAEHYWTPEPFKMVCNKSYLRRIQVKKRTRIRNQMDVSETVYAHRCGICSQTGHDRRKCPLDGNSNQARGGCSSSVPNYP